MTDNEIIKALECCSKSVTKKACKNCPFQDKDNVRNFNCLNLEKYTFDLINRQQAEIERLQEERDFYKAPSALLAKGIDAVKSEAIKEFAERLNGILKKKRKNEKSVLAKTRYGECILAVDNLAKEMTEVSK